ncbi:inositol monophosphatase family protein [Candidatus Omnitrophota bacterium]
MINQEIKKREKIAILACRQVGKLLLANFGRRLSVKSKGDRDLVTNIDQRADRIITGLIKKNFPEDGLISEESPHSSSRSGYSWIIDPIDGTHNFVHRIEVFGTSLAVAFNNQVVLGAIFMPVGDELYLARKGSGAFCNGKKITVSQRPLRESTIIYDSSIRYNRVKMLKALAEVAERAFNVRMFGSTVRSLTYVAQGKAEAEIEFNDKVWDFAAGLLLVEEAGGKSTDFQGQPWTLNTQGYIAANGIIHSQLLRMVKKAEREDGSKKG